MRTLRSRHRTPLCGTDLPHFELIDAGARVDYLLRAWPDPRLFRRVWNTSPWLESMPPRMDVAAWSRGEASWLEHLVVRPRSRTVVSPGQGAWDFASEGPHVSPDGIAGFTATIPQPVRDTLDGFRLGQFPLLQLLARHPPAREVVGDSPALVMALTDVDSFRDGPVYDRSRRIDALLSMRQRDALGWLGFPATNAARGVLRRLAREAVSAPLLLRLRTALHDETATRLLARCPRMHVGVVDLVANPLTRSLTTPRLLEDVAAQPDETLEGITARRVEDIATLASMLDQTVPPLRGLEEVRTRSLEMRQAWDLHARTRTAPPPAAPATRASAAPRAVPRPRPAPASEFPLPPLAPPRPSTGLTARPVTNASELKSWARRQGNCCAGEFYARRLRKGTLSILRLKLGQEEATLSLTRESGRWRQSELEGPRNTPCSPAMRQAVRLWLEQSLA